MSHENNRAICNGLLFIFLLFAGTALRATDLLERSVSVRFDQTPLKAALNEIARQGGFEWSYNARVLDESRRVTLVAEGWTVRETLVFLLGDNYTFKQNGEYLILKKRRKPQRRLSGYISDQGTGQRMANVTVYDRQTLRSTTTDRNGYYELPVTSRSEIVVSKLQYRDTVLQVSSQTPRLIKLNLISVDTMPQPAKPGVREELNRISVELEAFLVSSSQKLSSLNVRDSLHRHFQFSFLPGMSTNYGLSGSVTNNFSVNVLAGYSRGNRILEVAGLGNITREKVTGIQGAGLFNITGGSMAGLQAAGLFNITGGNATGLQWAGTFNLLKGQVRGTQVAGTYNFAGETVKGAQFAGVMNYADSGSPGMFQSAGILNLTPKGQTSVQLAGVANHAHRVTSFQAAGVVNTADTLHGCQLSGLINRAGYAKGTQIGLINFAREIDGVQIGLINLSRRGGYVVLELSANDVLCANAAFKSGVPGLYTILTAGADPESPATKRFWAYGLGLGTRLRLTRWGSLSFDLIGRHLNEGPHANAWQEWAQLTLAPEINLGRHFSIAGGPSANLFIADPVRADVASLRDRVVGRNWLDATNNADGWLSAWWGWTAGLRVRF